MLRMKGLLFGMLMLCSLFQSAGAVASACETEEYRQFDFWLGDWQVTQPDGSIAGTNTIAQAYDGCVLTEDYKVNGTPYGASLNAYDKSTGQWHQTWMDKNGTVLKLSGGIEQGSMVLSSKVTDAEGNAATHRITWQPQPGGTVTQHWQYKLDESDEWSTLFMGIYTRTSS
ncbi:hypothetical protein [Alteromonas facilis]|uniref:hypothetical protein n=1 Tax=Alteromonas facilis TaxID=2048004 RepID=UPI000C28F5E2|nr:hypothetical protein [Alteromonas facilis]